MNGLQVVEKVSGELSRRSERIRARIPVKLIWHEDMQRHLEETQTVSVSQFGCLVRCSCSMQPGTTLLVERNGKCLLGTVSYCLKDYATKRVELGIGFEEDSKDFWGIMFVA